MRNAGKLFVLIVLLILSVKNSISQVIRNNDYLIGKAKVETGQYDSALVYLDKALSENTNLADVYFEKGMALYHKSQYAMAIREFEQVEKVSKGKASIWIARCYANLRETDNCLKALEEHLTSSYKLPESSLLLDRDLKLLENDPKYEGFWKAGNWYTASDKAIAEAGYLMKSKQYPEAINVLSEALDKGYRKPPLYAKRAEVYMQSGNLKLALEDMNKSLALDRRNSELFVKRANVLYMTGKYKPALDDYNAALKISPDEISYYIGKAMALNKSGFYEDAVSYLKKYLELYPANDTVWYQSGMIHFDNGNYFEAINCFNNSLKINQHDARYFAARGATYLKTRTFQYAWKDLSMALDLDPKDSQTYVNKGIAALNIGNADDACFCFKMGIELGSKDAYNYSEKYCK